MLTPNAIVGSTEAFFADIEALPAKERLTYERAAEEILQTLRDELLAKNNTNARRYVIRDFFEILDMDKLTKCFAFSTNVDKGFTWMCLMHMKVCDQSSKNSVAYVRRQARRDGQAEFAAAKFLLPNC